MDALLALADRLLARGIALEHVDLGGGMGVRYRDEATPDLDAYAAAVADRLGDRPLEVLLEPGRSIVADAGVLLTRVLYLKENGGKRYAVVDAAMNDLLRPALYNAWHPVWVVDGSADAAIAVDLVGPNLRERRLAGAGSRTGAC